MTFDHPDPSIYCVLASPTAVPGTSNVELGCFPPRWSVAEHTFRPPPFHRNVASEFLGLISGEYIGKSDAFVPGSASLHNCMSGHGPDAAAYQRGRDAELKPQYLDNTLVFLFETQLAGPADEVRARDRLLERDYYTHWQGLKKQFSVDVRSAVVRPALIRRLDRESCGDGAGRVGAARSVRGAQGTCDRACLEGIAEQYLDALVAKDPKKSAGREQRQIHRERPAAAAG